MLAAHCAACGRGCLPEGLEEAVLRAKRAALGTGRSRWV